MERPATLSPRSVRYLQAIAVILMAAHVLRWLASSSWEFGGDMNAYWNAAVRLRAGAPLFPPVIDLNGHDVYRYSAWFAAVWVPLTFLDKGVVTVVWVGATAVAAAWLVLFAARTHTLASLLLAALLAPVLLQAAWYGQVQPLMAVFLVLALSRPAGPVAIGVAASLKLTPILFILIYVVNREWRKAASALVVAIALSAPTLAFDLANYPWRVGESISLATFSPQIWAGFVVSVLALAAVTAVRWPRHVGVAAGAAVALSGPRVYLDYATYLLPSLGERRR